MKKLHDPTLDPLPLYVEEDGNVRPLSHHVCAHCRHILPDRDAAKRCCAKYYCEVCKAETYQYHTLCGACRDQKQMDKAKEVVYEGGPVYDDATDQYYADLSDYLDSTDPGDEAEFVYLCKVDRLCEENAGELADRFVENLLQEHHEDARVENVDELEASIRKWLDKQTLETWHPDYSKKVRVPQTEDERESEAEEGA